MRKFLLILIPLLALIACFAIYLRFQPSFDFSIADKSPPDVFASGPAGNGDFVRPGHAAWVVQYDKNGRRSYQFKSDYYDNQPDGTVKVTRPVMEFFLNDDQILHIEGDDGIVRLAPGADKGTLAGAPPQPPRYGTLRRVVVKLFSSPVQQTRGAADLTIHMANAQFDNDTYRLFTHEYTDAGGQVIHQDQVPVTLWAKDYFFQGWGMVMYWNGLDKRLKSLEIEHSNDLTIYNTTALAPVSAEHSPAPAPAAPTTAPTPATIPANLAAEAPAPAPRQRYLATFYEQVSVWQADQNLARGSKMDVDFALKGGGVPSTEPSAPTTIPAPAPVASAATTKPSTAPAQAPIHVYWQGKMRMVPTDEATAEPLADGKAIIHLIGTPATLHQIGSDRQPVDVRCATAIFRTADSSARLEGDAQTPLLMTQTRADGAVARFTGPSLDFSKQDGTAIIHGQGQADLPDAKDPKAILSASWDKQCIVHLIDSGKGQMQITKADLFGNVVADHPRFHLTARDQLALTFDPPARDADSTSPQLRKILATGQAKCLVHETNQRTRYIAGETLQLVTAIGADGKPYPRQVNCDGSAVAAQDEQNLQAEHLQVALLPAPAKKQADDAAGQEMANVVLDQLIATDHVRLTGKNATSASADRLQVQMVDSHPRITFSGDARVADKTSTITGPVIHLAPHDQTASVDGPGTLDTLQKPADSSKQPKPLHLTWSKSATMDGQTNTAQINGDASADSKNPDGSHDTANSDRILVTLADVAPATKPAEDSPTSRPSDAEFGEMDFLKTKQIEKISLLADVAPATTRPTPRIGSELTDAHRFLLHKYDLWSQRIDYDAANRRLTVPGPGTIQAEQHQAPSATPTTQPDAGGHGTSRIVWQDRLVFDEPSRTAIIEGNVVIGHVNDGADSQLVRLEGADRVQVDLEPQDVEATRPAGADQPAMKIRRVLATGAITIATTEQTIRCGEVEFRPIESVLICRGGELGQVTVVDNKNINSGTFSEVWIDTATNKLIKLLHFSGQGR